jgi:hypothetical protein
MIFRIKELEKINKKDLSFSESDLLVRYCNYLFYSGFSYSFYIYYTFTKIIIQPKTCRSIRTSNSKRLGEP